MAFQFYVLLFSFFIPFLGAQNECPMRQEDRSMAHEFSFVLHRITAKVHKRESGRWRESAWQELFALFMPLSPSRRHNVVRIFCEGVHRGGANHEQCLEELFWGRRGPLKQLRKALGGEYTEQAALLHMMLLSRRTLHAQLLHAALPESRKRIRLEPVLDIVLGLAPEELAGAVEQCDGQLSGANGTLLARLERLGRHPRVGAPLRMVFSTLAERVRNIPQQQRDRLARKEQKREAKSILSQLWGLCRAPSGESSPRETNQLIGAFLQRFSPNSSLAREFASNFKQNCKGHIHAMDPVGEEEKGARRKSWRRKGGPDAAADGPKEQFRELKRMLRIAGLWKEASEFEYLAERLKRANLEGNQEEVGRILALHVGVDFSRVLAHYGGGTDRVGADCVDRRSGRSHFGNRTFHAIYAKMLAQMADGECFRLAEEGERQSGERLNGSRRDSIRDERVERLWTENKIVKEYNEGRRADSGGWEQVGSGRYYDANRDFPGDGDAYSGKVGHGKCGGSVGTTIIRTRGQSAAPLPMESSARRPKGAAPPPPLQPLVVNLTHNSAQKPIPPLPLVPSAGTPQKETAMKQIPRTAAAPLSALPTQRLSRAKMDALSILIGKLESQASYLEKSQIPAHLQRQGPVRREECAVPRELWAEFLLGVEIGWELIQHGQGSAQCLRWIAQELAAQLDQSGGTGEEGEEGRRPMSRMEREIQQKLRSMRHGTGSGDGGRLSSPASGPLVRTLRGRKESVDGARKGVESAGGSGASRGEWAVSKPNGAQTRKAAPAPGGGGPVETSAGQQQGQLSLFGRLIAPLASYWTGQGTTPP